MRLRPSGVTLDGLDMSGVDDATGVEVCVTAVTGWSGSPASTLTLAQKPAAHGAWRSNRPRFTARVIGVEGWIAGDPLAVADMVDRLNAVSDLDPVRLDVTQSGRTRWVSVQRQDEVLVDDKLAHFQTFSMQLAAADPLKYGYDVVGSTGLPRTAGGLSIPHAMPFVIASTITSGQVTAVNDGNASGPVLARIDGPVTAPVITHLGSGRALVFSSSLVIPAGDWLDVDMRGRQVLANGTAQRSGWVTSRGWSEFEQGANTWSFSASSASPTARLTITARPAWR